MVQVLLIDWPKVGWVLVGGWVWWVGLLAPNISVSSPGILKMVHQVDWWCSCWRWWTTPCPSSRCPPDFFWWTSRVDHSGPFLFSELFCGTPPSCLKVRGGLGGWVVAYRILVSAPVPFGLIWVSNWVGLDWDWGLRGWGLVGLGLGTRAWQ